MTFIYMGSIIANLSFHTGNGQESESYKKLYSYIVTVYIAIVYLIHNVIIFFGQMFSLSCHLLYLGLKTENFSILRKDKHTFMSKII